MSLIPLCEIDQVQIGEVIKVEMPGRSPIAVYNLDGAYFATDDICTHGDASLSEGIIDDDQIICPYHGGMFDIRTGEATGAPCIVALRTYPLSIEEGKLYVELP